MSTFDGWETRLCGDAMALPAGQLSDNELMHFRTKGSKNGVRRFQQADGTWTPLGLKERKEREGWGDGKAERKAAKSVAKSERRAAKAEKRSAKLTAKLEKKTAKKESALAKAEKKRLAGDISKLTDEELQKRIARVKMEQEYKELTRSPILKTGAKIVTGIMEMKANKARKEAEDAKRDLELQRIKADVVKAKETTKQKESETEKAKFEAKKAKQERKTKEADVEGGLKLQRKKELKGAKLAYRNTTIRGGIGTMFNKMATATGEARAERKKERAFVSGILRNKRRVDWYNKHHAPRGGKIAYDPDPWNRAKNKGPGGKKK